MSKIDVSKCKYFDEEYCSINKHSYAYCCQKEDCYFKQLEQLKAERDLLLSQLVILDGEDVTVQITQEQFEEYNKLKVENEELKDKNNSIHSIADGLQQRNHNLTLENEELKQKLEKIKEVINCNEYNKEHCIYCAEAHHCYTKQVLEIKESEN